MKAALSTFLLALVLATGLYAGGDSGKPAPVWLSFDAGLREARKSNKKILIDVYTDWCGWCKKMDKEVFAHAKIAPFLSDQYVLIKLNAESPAKVEYKDTKSTEMGIARDFGVTGYPTFIFLEPNGDLITSLPGFVKAEDFYPVLKYVAESKYKTVEWQAFYDQYQKEHPGGSLQ